MRRGLSKRNSLGLLGSHNRRLIVEALEDRRLLSVAPLNIALISDAVAQAAQIQHAAAQDTIATVYHADTMTATGMVDLLESVSAAHDGALIEHVGFVAHGSSGEIDLGKYDVLSSATLPSQAAALERLRSLLTSDARIDVYACSVAAGAGGKTFVDALSAATGAAVFASDNPVGTVPGADFIWEYRTGYAAVSSELLSVEKLGAVSNLSLYSSPNLANPAYTSGYFVTHANLVGQCTWYAYGRIQELGLVTPSQVANIFHFAPSSWVTDAHNAGFSTGSTPQAGALAIWSSGSESHVGFVESVSGTTIQVTECNYTPTATSASNESTKVVVGGAYVEFMQHRMPLQAQPGHFLNSPS